MKRPVWRVVVACLVMVVFLAGPVYANPVLLMYMKYNFSEDNHPINGPVNVTINCYGISGNDPHNLTSIQNTPITSEKPQLLYSDSTNCIAGMKSIEQNACDKLEVYEGYREQISGKNFSFCDAEGVYQNTFFKIKNFTTDPDSFCVWYGPYHYESEPPGDAQFYVVSKKVADFCDDRSDVIYNPCKTNKRYLTFDEFTQCVQKARSEFQTCYKMYGRPVDSTDKNYLVYPYQCEFRFDLPSGNGTSGEPVNQNRYAYTAQSPVESLYCSIISLFGAKC